MSEWRHADRALDVCYAPVQTGETPTPCGCYQPTPDPSSPCGHEGCHEQHWITGYEGIHDTDMGTHAVIPTRCTCGHTIERHDP